MNTLLIPIKPVAKARARHTVFQGRARSYTPKTTKEYETAIAKAVKKLNVEPSSKPISIVLCFTFKLPDTTPKFIRDRITKIAHTGKPDLDNLVKAVKDAMNGIAWIDDSQVTELVAIKQYGSTDAVNVVWEDVLDKTSYRTRINNKIKNKTKQQLEADIGKLR